MDSFCGSPFWDINKTWNTTNPELTSCMELTAVAWLPCVFLWIFAPIEVYYMLQSQERNVPWSAVNISKLVAALALTVMCFADLIHDSTNLDKVYPVHYVTPIIKASSYVLSAVLVYYLKKRGLRTSGVLFIFYLLSLLATLSPLRSVINTHLNDYFFDSVCIQFALVLISFLLSCFADLPPRESPYTFHKPRCSESASGFPSRMTFTWFDPMVYRGFKKDLTEADLWALNPEDAAENVVPRFEKYWQRTLDKHESSQNAKAHFTKSTASVDISSTKSKKPASILPALCMAFGAQFLLGAFLKLINDLMTFIPPQLLKYLINFVEGKEPVWRGYLYAAAFLVTASIQTMVLAHYFTSMYLVGMKIRTALTSAIYRKALRMSNAARKDSTVGEIVNLMAVDAQRFLELMAYINMVWSAPLQIGLALFFLWQILGPSVLAGLAVMIILIPVNGFIANKVKTLQIKQMKYKDERVKLMNEILNGIKVLKMYAWEPSYEEQVTKIRNKEMKVLKQSAYLNSATSFIWSCAPFLVTLVTFTVFVVSDPERNTLDAEKIFVSMSLFFTMNMPLGLLPIIVVSVVQVSIVSFACFVLISEENILDSKTAFVSLSLFNILRFPLSMLPNVISNCIQTSVGVKRLNKFMNCEELDPNAVEKLHSSDKSMGEYALMIDNGHFSWSGADSAEKSFELRSINVRIKAGSLVGIVGTVGSGKSSLLSAALGEMAGNGKVKLRGSVASVPQQPWIRNATLRDNVIFSALDYDKSMYNDVIERCALAPDIAMLPAGDLTEIGEKGVNLSGGQKARVALARALYAQRDVYFLDDPLSAVDAHVGRHLFDRAIGPDSVLRHTTRLWVTHAVTYLPRVDYILVMKDGRISEQGTFKELLEKKGDFAEFLLTHLSSAGANQEEAEILKQELEDKLGGEFREKLQRARSLSESASENSTSPAAGDRKTSLTTKVKEVTPQLQGKEKTTNKLIEAEKAETGSVKWSVYKHYLTSVGIAASIVTILMNMILQIFQIGSNVWLAQWSNDKLMVNITGTEYTARRDMYLGVYGGLGIGQAFSSFFADLLPYLSGWRAAKIIHKLLLANILRSPMSFFDTTPIGRVLARFSKDIDVVDLTLPQTLADIIFCVFEVIATLVVISISTPIFMVIIVPVGILYYVIQRFYVATSRQLKRLESITRSPIYSHFGETLTGATTIRAYDMTERFIKESDLKLDLNQECYYPSCIANRWLAVRLEMIGNFIIFFAALFSVLTRETVNSGLVGLSVSYALQITQTLNWMVRMTSEVETNIVAVERIKEYTEVPQEAAWEDDGRLADSKWPEKGAVEMQGLTIAYRADTEPVLRDLTCIIHPGEKIGVVGRTGAGKSTLALALFRIVEPMSGTIRVDGVDVTALGLGRLRSRVTVIPQDPVLFSGTLRMNLDPFDAYSDAQLWHALELSGLKTMVEAMTAGLRHEVTEGGDNLSLGQRQLVCLARALLRQSRLLVLDEATAAVDLDTDAAIQKTIRTEFRDATVLTIAHRLDTVLDANRVMVLDKGRLVEFDTPKTLLADRSSMFFGLAKEAGVVN